MPPGRWTSVGEAAPGPTRCKSRGGPATCPHRRPVYAIAVVLHARPAHGVRLALGARQVQNTLDPLLEVMTRDYIDDTDLTGRLNSLFKVCACACVRVRIAGSTPSCERRACMGGGFHGESSGRSQSTPPPPPSPPLLPPSRGPAIRVGDTDSALGRSAG